MDGTLGEIRPFGGNYAPENWSLCNGALLQVSQYQALFALLGKRYGGDGITNFAVPNLCGRVIIKDGTAPGLSSYVIGAQGGFEGVTLAAANLALHSHTVAVSTLNASTDTAANNYMAAMIDNGNPSFEVRSYLPNDAADTNQELVPLNSTTIGAAPGGNQPHENRMPFMAITYIICTTGMYPDFQ